MPELVFYLLVFFVVGAFFLFFHLAIGRLVRPFKPETDKLTIYECGEPTVGSAWVQFDLRYYVVALLFVIFDVEVAFFFPWAVVFGTNNQLARSDLDKDTRTQLTAELNPANLPVIGGVEKPASDEDAAKAAQNWAKVALFDILVFFGVLMVGFAYLWKRGDIAWVRGRTAPEPPAIVEEAPVRRENVLVGAGH